MCPAALLFFRLLARSSDIGLQRLSRTPGATEAADHGLLSGIAKGKPWFQMAKDQVHAVVMKKIHCSALWLDVLADDTVCRHNLHLN